MTKQSWKGLNLTYGVYRAALSNKVLSENRARKIVLMRRNVVPTKSIIKALGRTVFSVYNGYDFFVKTPDNLKNRFNLGSSVSTRELDVRHKVKLTKQARKNMQMRKNKKTATSSSATKKTVKKTKK